MRVNGLIMQMAITTELALKMPYAIIGNKKANMKSMVTMSLENLVIILPIGLESKNKILALNTLSDIALCMLVALVITIRAIIADLITLKTKYTRIAIPKFL